MGGNHANGTRLLSCIVSSIIIDLCFFQIIVNYVIIAFLYRNKHFLILSYLILIKLVNVMSIRQQSYDKNNVECKKKQYL